MIWHSKEEGKEYLYTVMRTKRYGKLPWQMMRGCLSEGGPQHDRWEPACLPCYATCGEAEAALRDYAQENGWIRGDCDRCWHLDKEQTGCGFFNAALEQVPIGYWRKTLRCAGCLEWGASHPG